MASIAFEGATVAVPHGRPRRTDHPAAEDGTAVAMLVNKEVACMSQMISDMISDIPDTERVPLSEVSVGRAHVPTGGQTLHVPRGCRSCALLHTLLHTLTVLTLRRCVSVSRPALQISPEILTKVIDWCDWQYRNKDISDFATQEKTFHDGYLHGINDEVLFTTILAANFLNIKKVSYRSSIAPLPRAVSYPLLFASVRRCFSSRWPPLPLAAA